MSPKRIVFAGVSGIRKIEVLKKFRAHVARVKGFPGDDASLTKLFPIAPAERDIPSVPKFLRTKLTGQIFELWNSYQNAIDAIKEAESVVDVQAVLIPIHLTHMDDDRLFSSLAWINDRDADHKSLLLWFLDSIQPDYIVNLIDDCHYIQDRMRTAQTGFDIRLRDILKWREMEGIIADYSANEVISPGPNRTEKPLIFPFERSPIFAIRHDCDALYKYLFQPETPRVYLSYLISEVRRSEGDRRQKMEAQLNNLVRTMSSWFCAFNPLTIDEKPLEMLAPARKRAARKKLQLDLTCARRWPIGVENTLTSDPVRDMCAISDRDLEDICTKHGEDKRTVVDRQVEVRDFRLIEQSDCMVLYRPTNKAVKRKTSPDERWGSGCRSEFQEAQAAMSTRRPHFHIYVVVDHDDYPVDEILGISEGSPFNRLASRIKVFKVRGLDDCQDDTLAAVAKQIMDDTPQLISQRQMVPGGRVI